MMVEECVKFMFMIWNLLLSYNSSSLVIFYSRYRPQSLGLQFLLLYLSIQLITSYSLIFIHPAHPILLSYIYPSSSSHPTLLYLSVPLIPSHSTLFYLSFQLIPSCFLIFIRYTHPILLTSIYLFHSSHPVLFYLFVQVIPSYSSILTVPFIPYSLIFIRSIHPILLSYIRPLHSSHPTLLYLSFHLIPSYSLIYYYTAGIWERIILLESRKGLYFRNLGEDYTPGIQDCWNLGEHCTAGIQEGITLLESRIILLECVGNLKENKL